MTHQDMVCLYNSEFLYALFGLAVFYLCVAAFGLYLRFVRDKLATFSAADRHLSKPASCERAYIKITRLSSAHQRYFNQFHGLAGQPTQLTSFVVAGPSIAYKGLWKGLCSAVAADKGGPLCRKPGKFLAKVLGNLGA